MAKFVAKIVIEGAQVVGRAFARALRQEIQKSNQEAAKRRPHAGKTNSDSKGDLKLGISLEESIQILNINKKLNKEEVEKSFNHLFKVNQKEKGGSFYIQSKVVRAKERIDEEFGIKSNFPPKNESKPNEPDSTKS